MLENQFAVVCTKDIFSTERDVSWNKGDIFAEYPTRKEAIQMARTLNEDDWAKGAWSVAPIHSGKAAA